MCKNRTQITPKKNLQWHSTLTSMADNPNEINAWNGWNNLFHPGSLIPYSWSIHWAVFLWGMPQMQPSLSSTNWNMTWKFLEKNHLVSYIFGVAKLFADHLSVSQGVMCCFDFFMFNSLEKNTMVQQNGTQPFWLTSYLSSLPFKAKPSPGWPPNRRKAFNSLGSTLATMSSVGLRAR